MRFANIKELQKDASGIISAVEHGEDVIIVKHGKPTAVIYPLNEEQIEDYLIHHSPAIRKKLTQGLKDIQDGNVTPLDELLKSRKARKRDKA